MSLFHLLSGELVITLDGRSEHVTAGDTVISWVTTSIGLEAELTDGTRVVPPWAN